MVWKIFSALSLVLAAVAALVSATTAPEYKTGAEWVIALLFVALAVFLFWKGAKSSAGKKEKRQGGNGTYMTEQELQQIQGGVLPALASVPVVLGEGEVAHFFAPARRYVTKKKAVGRTGSGGGVSVRVVGYGKAGPVRRSMTMSRTPSTVWRFSRTGGSSSWQNRTASTASCPRSPRSCRKATGL